MSASANEEATAREDTTMKRDHRSKAAQNRQEVKAVVVGFPVQACAPFRPKPVRITELTKANAAILQKFFGQSLISLRRSFHARRNVVNSYGDVIDLGPDYRTRIAALHTLLDICTRGRQSLASEKSSYGVSWEEIKAYAEHINLPGMNPSRPESASAPAALRASGSGDLPWVRLEIPDRME